MHWMDDAAFVCGADWAGAQVLASYIGGIRLYRAIIIGHVVEVTARLIHTGPRSMHLIVHAVQEAFEPEGGAYAQGHAGHGHDHGHGHPHGDHGHAH